MKINNIHKCIIASITFIAVLAGCSDSWLDPKPLSLYTPENSFTNAEGLYAGLAAAERNMRHEYTGEAAPIQTEIIHSDIAVNGCTDRSSPQKNMDIAILPDANLDGTDHTRIGWYWNEGYSAIKYANLVISRLDDAEFKDQNEKNAVLGAAYFQRAYRYYKLTHQFGDVPYIDWEITGPVVNLRTYDRWSILERMKKDLEFAYEWVPQNVLRGKTSKGACGMLLMKICIELGDYDRAIQVGQEVTAAYPLMTQRFTANKTKPNTNLMHDLHSVEAKTDPANTEGIMYVVSYTGIEGSTKMDIMRGCVPFWNSSAIKTPTGKTGTTEGKLADGETNPLMNLNQTYGRGIGRVRTSDYFAYDIWGLKEANDLRGIYNNDSWKHTSDLQYNEPSLKRNNDPWYGQNIQLPVSISKLDSMRVWYAWPHYKTFVPDPLRTRWDGGDSPWYIYRSAEAWLLLAEAHYWKGELGPAATAINNVRTRAGADPLTAADINIGEILNERARELFYEEARHTEIVRIAYTFAKSGKSCEVFGGRVYSLTDFSGPGGTNSNIKQEGYNFWWDWVNSRNNFYNKVNFGNNANYKISVHHVLWPIPASEISLNTQGVINQNIGYPGAENNQPPLTVPPTGTVMGPAGVDR
ncbi:RagB/SusD family nutrient uptake outer membrane protein [Dysgonomonas sp. 25]|uniref:RagB/SusD family nutrient uptake outer membrane protein n=1 Tax=Dysgonomonas sp. 25 TaxID=2302933 RepID=UPI0013D8687D|nr:RagB/SusD family nutrient uptake outer membrane protein [Dysgonomonas sp. 25]NDV67416.1 RagB/SusD family nutrient uptake outer membrane protein [Dysgonomonas sp. 25]